jgi:hypothetical protein
MKNGNENESVSPLRKAFMINLHESALPYCGCYVTSLFTGNNNSYFSYSISADNRLEVTPVSSCVRKPVGVDWNEREMRSSSEERVILWKEQERMGIENQEITNERSGCNREEEEQQRLRLLEQLRVKKESERSVKEEKSEE